MDFGARPTEEGIFVIHGLQAGKHSAIVNAPGSGARGGPPRLFVEEIQVPESGDTEVNLVVGGTQTVSGEVILEDPPDPKQQLAAQPQQPESQDPVAAPEQQRPVTFLLESMGPFPFPGRRGTVSPKGGPFELAEVPSGDYRMRVFGMPDGGYLRSVTLDGRDLGGPAITVPRDGPLSGLKLHLAFDGASVSGQVKPAPGEEARELSGGEFVVAVPDDDSTEYAGQSMSRVGQDGVFSIRGLVPGGYLLFVVPSLNGDVSDPDLRRALKPYTKAVSLDKKEQARVELTAAPESVELW
jgi:hypothetical protein